MSKPRKILFDVDGVLADFSQAFREHMNRLFDLQLKDEPTEWYWGNLVTPEQFNEAWKAWAATPNVWTTLPPLADAYALAEAIQKGKLEGCETWFVTSRGRSAGRSVLEQTKEWLSFYIAPSEINVIVVDHSSDKRDVVCALGMTHSIDDFAPTVISLNHQRGHDAFLLRKPWNEYELRAYNLPWVKDMYEFLNLVRLPNDRK